MRNRTAILIVSLLLFATVIALSVVPSVFSQPASVSGPSQTPAASAVIRISPATETPTGAVTFSPATYRVATEPGRFIVTAALTVAVETDAFVALPVSGLGLLEVRLDGQLAVLVPGDEGSRFYTPKGRRQLLIRGSLPLTRNRIGIYADWAPGCAGVLADSGSVRVEGALPTAGGWALTGGPVKLIAGRGPAGDAVGRWMADLRSDFIIGAETVNAALTLEFKAFGLAGETFAVALPPFLLPMDVAGDAEAVALAPGLVVLRPATDQGKITFSAEGRFTDGKLDLAGLGLLGVPYSTRRLRLLAAEGAELELAASEGLTPEMNNVLRVIGDGYQLQLTTRKIEATGIMEAEVSQAALVTVVRADGKQENRLTLTLNGQPGEYLTLTLPAGARIESATAGENPIAPVQTRDGYLIPLKNGESTAGIVYSETGSDWWFWNGLEMTAPRVKLPVQNYSWQVWVPERSAILSVGGVWRWLNPWPTPLRIVDRLTDASSLLVSLAWWLVKWGLLAAAIVGVLIVLVKYAGGWIRKVPVPSWQMLFAGGAFLFIVFIVGAMFLPMFDLVDVVGTQSSEESPATESQAGLRAGMYRGANESRGDGVEPASPGAPAVPAATSDIANYAVEDKADTAMFFLSSVQEAPPPPPPTPAPVARRRGSVSINVQFPLEGTPHRFGRSDLESGGALRLVILGKKTRYVFLLALLAISGGLVWKKSVWAIPLLLVAAVFDSVLPGAFPIMVLGIVIAIIARRLKQLARLGRKNQCA